MKSFVIQFFFSQLFQQDAVSSLSNDSGNVFDSRSSLDGVPTGASNAYPGFPKSKSVPEWMVDATQKQLGHLRVGGGGGSAGGGGGATTDSGLSATSADSSNAAEGMAQKASERLVNLISIQLRLL